MLTRSGVPVRLGAALTFIIFVSNRFKMLYPILTYSRDSGDFSHDLAALHKCGLKAIRLIYKGKTEAEMNSRIREIQDKIRDCKLELDIVIDLPGNKPIVGGLPNPLNIVLGKEYRLTDQSKDSLPEAIPTLNFFSHERFAELKTGDVISVADDELNFLVTEISESYILCKAHNSFRLTSNRSISVKNKPFDFFANSAKDLLFVENMKEPEHNVKLLVSFTRKADDILKLKYLQPDVDIIPKIENVLDDATLVDILSCCQTIMLGRGDLSTSSAVTELFSFQKRLINLCMIHNKRLIIGTGLLQGIGHQQSPSIAEIMDYGYLCDRGIDAFLISGRLF
jgi:pyruvate kinase